MNRFSDPALRYATAAIFVAVLAWFGVQSPDFLSVESLGNIVKQSSFIGIAAIGITFVLLIAGILMRDLGVGVPGGLATAVLAGAALGAINAAVIVGLGIVPFIVTLANLFAFRGFGAFLTGLRQFDFEPAMREFGLASVAGVPVPVIFFAILAIGAHVLLSRTLFGRQVYAIGNDPEAARKGNCGQAGARGRTSRVGLRAANARTRITTAP